MKPESKWFFEVRRTDGTIRYPLGDRWVDNVVLNQFKNQVLNNGGIGFYNGGTARYYDFLNLFFLESVYNWRSVIELGSSNTAATATQTALQSYIKSDNGFYASGNTATVSPTTGDFVATIKKSFAVETGSVTYREAGLKCASTSGVNGGPANLTAAGMLMNRVTFSDITLSSGEQLIVTVAVKVPTLTVNGQTITISAQNGVDISGTLKLVGTTSRILGLNTLTTAGVLTNNSATYGTIFPTSQNPTSSNQFYLTTTSSHAAFNTAASGLNSNVAGTNGWATYTTDNFYRDFTGTWASGGSDITFQSINLITGGGGTSGYQLLCTSSQTKAAAATLSLSLRFSLS